MSNLLPDDVRLALSRENIDCESTSDICSLTLSTVKALIEQVYEYHARTSDMERDATIHTLPEVRRHVDVKLAMLARVRKYLASGAQSEQVPFVQHNVMRMLPPGPVEVNDIIVDTVMPIPRSKPLPKPRKATNSTPPKRNHKGSVNFDPDEKLKIIQYKRAMKRPSDVTTVKHFSNGVRRLNPRTVRKWETHWLKYGNFDDRRAFSTRKSRLCDDMQKIVFRMFRAHRLKAHAVTTNSLLIMAKVALRAQKSEGKHKEEDCGCTAPYLITYKVMRTLRKKWKIVYRSPTTDRAPITEQALDTALHQLQQQLVDIIIEHDITGPAMIVNMDELALEHVQSRNKTLDAKGTHDIALTAVGEKRNVTVVVAGNAHGDLLPFQVIFHGKTNRVHPSINWPPPFSITHNENHWATGDTVCKYIGDVLMPFFEKMRAEYKLTCPGVVLMDGFGGHLTADVYAKFTDNNIIPLTLPPNLTHKLQPCDLSVCGTVKRQVLDEQEQYLMEQLEQSLPPNIEFLTAEELSASVAEVPEGFKALKEVSATWLVNSWTKLVEQKQFVINGWRKAGILGCIDEVMQLNNQSTAAQE